MNILLLTLQYGEKMKKKFGDTLSPLNNYQKKKKTRWRRSVNVRFVDPRGYLSECISFLEVVHAATAVWL